MEYDQRALAAQLAAANNEGKDKKDEDEIPKPISGKERDKVARTLFVDRVKAIYTGALAKELTSGTAISHNVRFGLDPSRLLREGDDETERETKRLLQDHVANNLYFMKNIEWEIGAESYKEVKPALCHESCKQHHLDTVSLSHSTPFSLFCDVPSSLLY